eukprot:12502294-Alexandrium_andersonii.AAC.1
MGVARLGLIDGARGDVSALKVPSSGVAPGTARVKRIVLRRHVKVPAEYVFAEVCPELAMTIGKEIARRQTGRKDVTLWAETGPS